MPVTVTAPPTVIVSPTGVQGPRGNAVLNGVGAPSSGTGIDGDYYVDTTNYPTSAVLYGPKVAGAWPGSGITFGGAGTVGALLAENNLSDVQNATTSRNNLGLGTVATHAVGDFDTVGAAAVAQAAAATDATTKANAAQAAAIGAAATDATMKADAATAAAEADAAAKYLALDGGGTVDGTVTIVDGNLIVDSTGTAINAVDRGATTNYAAYGLRTAGVDRWAWQMGPGSQDLYLVDSANGVPVLRVQPGVSGPNVALLDGGVDFGDGVGVLHLPNAVAIPDSNPASGAVLYVEGGVLKVRSASGTIGVVLPAGSGGSSTRTASIRITDDNLGGLPSAASWTIVQTSATTKLQCSIAAAVGDRIKVHGGFMRAGSHFLDWALLDNAGAIAIYAGTFTSSPLPEGDPDLYPSLSFGYEEMVEMFTIGAGHINAGSITVALAHQGTGSGVVYAHTAYPFRMRLENIGPEPA